MELIICHINADFDCLASMIGAKKLYPGAVPVFPGAQERTVREFLKVFDPLEIRKVKHIDQEDVRRLIIVDTSAPSRIGAFEKTALSGKVKLHIYDHHPLTGEALRGEVEVVEDVGATATIFAELMRKEKITLSPIEATTLCLGIYEETGSLRFSSTRERDLHAVAYLLRQGADLKIVSEYLEPGLKRKELELLNELISSSRDISLYGARIRTVKAVRNEYYDDVAHLAHRIMDMEEIDALVMLLAMDDKVVMIGRSRIPELDVGEVLESFGGGGHPVAASATVKDEPLEILEERLIEKVKISVRPQREVQDIMTSPVITALWKTTVKKAESTMTKYGVNVLPVLKDDRYYGLLSREVVEKALFHGFGRSSIYEFATTDAEVTSPDAPLADVESAMIRQNQRFMPVLRDDMVVGAITRTDLLRNLYEETLRKSRIKEEALSGKPSLKRNVSKLLRDRFPKVVVALLMEAGRVADSLGYSAYLVGGTVRDLLRGEKNFDMDIVIEGDGILFGKKFARSFKGAKLITHSRFNTAKIRFKPDSEPEMPAADFTVDIATARTEYYEEPAALPTVETSSIKKDLYRRDFTINTLAVKLNSGEFGQLIDYFGAQRDIRDGTLRVLHNLSFVEDPTRAFRAVRFAERFKFRINRHTEKLIKSALRLNLFEGITGSRLYDEMVLTFQETEPVNALKRLARYGLLKVVHPELSFTSKLESIMQSVHESIAWFDLLFIEEEVDRSRIYIMGLLTNLEPDERKEALQRLSTPEREVALILEWMDEESRVIKALSTDDAAMIYHALEPLTLEVILYTVAVCRNRKVQKAVSRYLMELRNASTILRGRDLVEMGVSPGPLYSEILEKLLDERLRGSVKSRNDEKTFVEDYLRKRGI